MGRVLIGALIVALIASVGAWLMYTRYQAEAARDQKKIADLQSQMQTMQQQTDQLKQDLAKAQSEEDRLEAANQDLAKTLAQARLTGKIPPLPLSALPYPPK
jgi:predicted  nucleic acid-binding Zn-ribbon protein